MNYVSELSDWPTAVNTVCYFGNVTLFVKLYYCLYSSKNLTTPHGRELNPPDLWIHGTVAEVDDKMSDYERNSMARPSSRAARSDRTGSFSCCIYNRIFIVFI